MADSIIYFTKFTFFFWLYLVFIPAKVMGLKLMGKGAGENALKALTACHVTVISCVYVLGLLHIYHTATLVLSIVIVILGYWKIIKKISYKEKLMNALEWLGLVSSGQYRISIFLRDRRKSAGQGIRQFFRNNGKKIFSRYILVYLMLFFSLGALIAGKWRLVFDNYAYLTSDMYVHNDWINFMEQGDIFYDGVYPFGMHNMLSAFHKLSGLNLNVVFRYWGAFNCLLLAVMLWMFANRIFHSRVAALLPVVIYCVTDFTSVGYGYRSIYTLPQETGMLFLFPCVYFLGRFLKNRKWKDGIYFALSAAIILSMHFYTVIFAVLLCGSVCVVFIRDMFRKEMIKKLFLSVGLIVLISITPFVAGLVSGKYWQGSMTWAMGVINSSMEEEGSAEADTEENEDQEEEADSAAEESGSVLQTIKSKLIAIYDLQVEAMNSYWGPVFWVTMGLFVIYYAVLLLRRRVTWKDKMYAGVWIFLFLLIIMYSYWILGIPKIMKEERMKMFIGYVAPLVLALPAEMICRILPGKVKVLGTAACCGMAAVLCYLTYGLGYMAEQTYFYLEPSLAAKVCVKADDELEKGTWTIVSPVEAVSLVRNRGYHYELWEFISEMEMYRDDMYLEIPTQYVFFVLEKNPIDYNMYRVAGVKYETMPLDVEDASQLFTREALGISETGVMKFYSIQENRRIMEAKLYCWIEEYSKAFPDQMEVYMEDEECIVYKFEQNPYMLNNFAIDYGYNEASEQEAGETK